MSIDHVTEAASPAAPDLLPARMLNEFAYCRRLFHLMHVEGRWADNAFTDEGRWAHRRVDAVDDVLPDAKSGKTEKAEKSGKNDTANLATVDAVVVAAADPGDDPPIISRSVTLSSDDLGLIAKLDLVETSAPPVGPLSPPTIDDLTGTATPPPGAPTALPVETKRGRVPNNPERSWEPERIQLMAQGLLLRAHGYACDRGILYFQASRTRVTVPFTARLEADTIQHIAKARVAAHLTVLPEPLIDSPKCPGCSLNAICLPDETHALQMVPADPAVSESVPPVRRLYPPRDDATPLYVQEQGATIGKRGEGLRVTKGGETLTDVRLKDVSHVALCGSVMLTPGAFHLLGEAGVPVVHLSMGHWFYGITTSFALRNAYDRAAQFRAADDPARCLALARAFVSAKGQNQRTRARRNAEPMPAETLQAMGDLLKKVPEIESLESLLGIEGSLASHYFSALPRMIRPKEADGFVFDFASRNRRPPKDPVNSLLSFGYALLAKECTVALAAVGLDPFWGFYHQPRHGRPALALDLMEEFRPLVVDSAVITAINTGMVSSGDFEIGSNGCVMSGGGRKSFIRAYEARLDQLATHPIFDYRCSWRRLIAMQAQLLARYLRGDVPAYQGIVTR